MFLVRTLNVETPWLCPYLFGVYSSMIHVL